MEMQKTNSLLTGCNKFLTPHECNIMIFYMLFYGIFSLNILPIDFVLLPIVILFLLAPVRTSLIMYVFFILWEDVAVFSFGPTLGFMFRIILFIKIAFLGLSNRKDFFFSFWDFIFMLGVGVYGVLNLFYGMGNLSGIGLAFNVFIALYAFNIYSYKNQTSGFWEAVFFTLMLSTFFASVYGYFNETAVDRWISGMGYVKQLTGTVGTARIGMYLCASLIYPVFYVEKSSIKIILCIIFSLGALLTFSVTTLICLTGFWITVIIFKSRVNLIKFIQMIVLTVVCISVGIFLWDKIQDISFVKPTVLRLEKIISALQTGDTTTATSFRAYLAEVYLNDFAQYPLFNKTFGSFYINRFSVISSYDVSIENYAHNSYIDILLYTGILGLLAFLIRIPLTLSSLVKSTEFLPVVLLKLIFLTTGMSVSMLGNSFWFFWIIL